MSTNRNRHFRKTRTVLGAALAVVIMLPTASADTMSYADAMSEFAKQCGSDIKKHCNGINLANGKVQACLEKSRISAGCSQAIPTVTASIQQREAAQASFTKACGNDALRLCKGVTHGDAHILKCLLKASHAASAACNQAITDAGWR